MTDKLVVFLPGFGSVEMPLIDFDPKRKPLDMLDSLQTQKKSPKTDCEDKNGQSLRPDVLRDIFD